MNGAVMDHEDSAFLCLQKNTSGQHCPEYHRQIHHALQQSSLHHHNKAMTYHLSDRPIVNDLSEHLRSKNTHTVAYKHLLPSGSSNDPRQKLKHALRRELLELPVPTFEMDENCVAGSDSFQQDQKQNSKDLDLDTRIGLLIKSKALAGVHPIFSELDESTSDSDELILGEIKSTDKFNQTKNCKSVSSLKDETGTKSFDDCEKPLSRPPSPFLSRATYLFWFNKAIELKLQAKAQEKTLLEKAAKKLIHEHNTSAKINRTDYLREEEENFMMKHVLNEVSNKFKEVVKKDFINKILENTIVSTFESWWEEEKHQEIKKRQTISKLNTNVESKEDLRIIDDSQSFPVSKMFNSDNTDKNIDAVKIEDTIDDQKLLNKIPNLKQENIVSSTMYLEITDSKNNMDLLCSLDVKSDVDFKRNTILESSFVNVNQSIGRIINMNINNQRTTSYHISHITPTDDLIVNITESAEDEIEVVKNVLNLIVDNVERITMQVTADPIN